MSYIAYIEEAGDEGICRGSRWFIVGAVLVKASLDPTVSKCIDDVKELYGLEKSAPLHWRNIKHASIKRGIAERVSCEDFSLVYVVCDTSNPNIAASTLRGNGRLYSYLLRYLLERVSWFGRDKDTRIDLVLANRSNVNYSQIRDYFEKLKNDKRCRIEWDYLNTDGLQCLPNDQRKMLQVADVCLGACFNALEADRYGYTEERYLMSLCAKLYRRNGNLYSYGLKFVPSNLQTNPKIRELYPWLKYIENADPELKDPTRLRVLPAINRP